MATQFKNLAVSSKVVGAFAVVLAATIALGLFSVLRLSQLNTDAQDVSTKWLPGMKVIGQLEYSAARLRSWQGATVNLSTPELIEKGRQNRETLSAQVSTFVQKLGSTARSDREKAIADRIAAGWATYQPMEEKELQLLKTSGRDAAFAYYIGDMMQPFNDFKNAIEEAATIYNEGGAAAGTRGQETFQAARIWIFVAIGLAAILCVFAGYTLVGAVSKPLENMTLAMGELASGNLNAHVPHADQEDEIGKLADAMARFKEQLAAAEKAKAEQTEIIVSSIGTGLDHLAKGDLTHRVTAELAGPFSKLKNDFNLAMERIQSTLKNVLEATHLITNGASEISQASDDLSRRTEQQAASLEETAAALEEITATVKQTAANAKQASVSVNAARTSAQDGGRIVETAVQAMDSIAQSSKKITDIIGVIDEIAFQTNLLALNAGVEAARVGEAGRGFAVVAGEVRALAQRSSEAAKEIKTLIHVSSEHVNSGVKQVGDSGVALKQIVNQVEQISSLIQEMAMAAEQQSTGIEEVNAAVSQMDQVTQQNAAMVEQSTASSRNLAGETHSLQELVGFFNVGGVHNSTVGAQTSVRSAQVAGKVGVRPGAGRRPAVVRTASAAVARKAVAETDDWTEF